MRWLRGANERTEQWLIRTAPSMDRRIAREAAQGWRIVRSDRGLGPGFVRVVLVKDPPSEPASNLRPSGSFIYDAQTQRLNDRSRRLAEAQRRREERALLAEQRLQRLAQVSKSSWFRRGRPTKR